MSQTSVMESREERFSALDQFAREADNRRAGDVAAVSPFASPVDRVFGAQQVAVVRDEGRVLNKLKALAAAAGTDWYYRFPVRNRKENRTDWIEGPSIKMANDLARIFGNCDVDVRVQDLGDAWLFYARFIDLETGFSLVRPFQQRKSAGKIGGDDDARRLDIAFQIGASKAIRNVVVNALQTFADFAFEEAKGALVEKIGRDLAGWREKIRQRIADHVDVKRVEAVIGRVVGEWLAPDIARVVAMMKAVQDGMASMDDTFPPLNGAAQGGQAAKPGLDQFAAGTGKGGKQDHEAEPKPSEGRPASETGAGEQGDSPSPSKPAPASPDARTPETRDGASGDGHEGDPCAAAHRRGQEARTKGMSRKAAPQDVRDDPVLLAAWQDGFDGESLAEREPGEEG